MDEWKVVYQPKRERLSDGSWVAWLEVPDLCAHGETEAQAIAKLVGLVQQNDKSQIEE